jgi:hypothetical protein
MDSTPTGFGGGHGESDVVVGGVVVMGGTKRSSSSFSSNCFATRAGPG